jgi:hypothetical protein
MMAQLQNDFVIRSPFTIACWTIVRRARERAHSLKNQVALYAVADACNKALFRFGSVSRQQETKQIKAVHLLRKMRQKSSLVA